MVSISKTNLCGYRLFVRCPRELCPQKILFPLWEINVGLQEDDSTEGAIRRSLHTVYRIGGGGGHRISGEESPATRHGGCILTPWPPSRPEGNTLPFGCPYSPSFPHLLSSLPCQEKQTWAEKNNRLRSRLFNLQHPKSTWIWVFLIRCWQGADDTFTRVDKFRC